MKQDAVVMSLLKAREGVMKEYTLALDRVRKARSVMDELSVKASGVRQKLINLEHAIEAISPDSLKDDNHQEVTEWLRYALTPGGKSLATLQSEGEIAGFTHISIKNALTGVDFTKVGTKTENGFKVPAMYMLRDNLYKESAE